MIPLLLACAEPAAEPVDGVLDQGPLNPFPSFELVEDGHLAIADGLFPVPEGGTALDVRRLDARTGFSPVQTAVVMLDEAVDPESLPSPDAGSEAGSVQLWDLDAGARIPCFAELDAHPDALAAGRRTLIVRPLRAMTPGHSTAVVLTRGVTTEAGVPLDDAAWRRAVAADPHYAALADALAGLGVTDVALAWDYPVGEGTGPLDAMVVDRGTPGTWTFTRTAQDEDVVEGVWKQAEGHFTARTWLVDDRAFAVDDAGAPVPQGEAEVDLYVMIPESLREATEPAPVLVFGHGFLREPGDYLADPDDTSRVIEVANRLGAVVVGSTWRGLTTDDLADAVAVARDFGRLPELTDRLTQAVVNHLLLLDLLTTGGLADDPFLEGRADPSRIRWYGISLGSIEGAVVLANQDVVEHAVLHVGGGAWSTMLERSSNWPVFESQVRETVPDPHDRQLLYAASQLWWDPADPAAWVERLTGRPLLWQEAIGDDQVPNLATELLIRSLGVPLAEPSVTVPFGLPTTPFPLEGPALVQFDPEVGLPPEENRPAPDTDAHELPRRWEGTVAQTVEFLATGLANHHCGDQACAASNPGG